MLNVMWKANHKQTCDKSLNDHEKLLWFFTPPLGPRSEWFSDPKKGTLRPECIKLIMVCMPPRPAPITCRDHCIKGPGVIEGWVLTLFWRKSYRFFAEKPGFVLCIWHEVCVVFLQIVPRTKWKSPDPVRTNSCTPLGSVEHPLRVRWWWGVVVAKSWATSFTLTWEAGKLHHQNPNEFQTKSTTGWWCQPIVRIEIKQPTDSPSNVSNVPGDQALCIDHGWIGCSDTHRNSWWGSCEINVIPPSGTLIAKPTLKSWWNR